MPSEIIQHKRTNISFHLYKIKFKFIETENRMMVCRVWGKEEMLSYYLMSRKFLCGMMEKFWEWIMVMVVQHCECNQCH